MMETFGTLNDPAVYTHWAINIMFQLPLHGSKRFIINELYLHEKRAPRCYTARVVHLAE